MQPDSNLQTPSRERSGDPGEAREEPRAKNRPQGMHVAVLTGGGDRPYALGLALSLVSQEIAVDFIGSDEVDGPELHENSLVRFLNLRGNQRRTVRPSKKAFRLLRYYLRLLRYARIAEPKIFHILWNNRLLFLDRTLLTLCYRILGRRLVLTVHNVNAGQRDGNDSLSNRVSLRIQYHLVHHLFVHTRQMKEQLQTDFGVPPGKVTVIPFGINSTVPDTDLTTRQAKARLGLAESQKAILFFGNIAPYKGLKYLVDALEKLLESGGDYRLIIAGRPKGSEKYFGMIQERIARAGLSPHVIQHIEYVPDEDTEIYFKAADVLVLPYTQIFQSGVLFLGYNFGIPVVASDVGSLREDIVEGETGLVCKPQDATDLAGALRRYFSSPLFSQLEERRPKIREMAMDRYSWAKVGEITKGVYLELAKRG